MTAPKRSSTSTTRRPLLIANRHPRLRLDRPTLAAAVAALDAHAQAFRGGCPAGELSLAFLTDAALAQLHAAFLADPTNTDVITFSAPPHGPDPAEENSVAGEICISVDAAVRQTSARRRGGLRALDFAGELTLYVVHGWLHLAGYDDLSPEKKRAMRRAEARALTLLHRTGKFPRFTLAPRKR